MSRDKLFSIRVLKAAVIAALLGTTSAMAAIPVTGDKVGSLITVKTGASHPSVASDAAGDSAVVWDVPGGKIVVQRYDADGNPVGARFQANTSTTGNNEGSKIAMDAAGDFVVVWTGDGGTATSNVFAQLFDKSGNKVGTEFQVNKTAGTAFPNSNEHFPESVAMDATGGFVVVWTGTDAGDGTTPDAGIFAQRFDNTGAALTDADIAVNTATTGRQVSPTIAMSPGGAYVIAYTGVDDGGGTPDEGIFAVAYDANGAVTKAEFAVNTATTGAETLPAAGMDLAGEFVVAWSSKAVFANNLDIHAQRFDATGTAVGSEFLVNANPLGNQVSSTLGVQSDASVGMDVNGDFVIAWDSQFDDTAALGDYANLYGADGSLQAGAKVEGLADTGFAPAVAMDAGGDVIASATITTNAVSGLFAQRFAGFNPIDLAASLSTTAPATVQPGDAIALTASVSNLTEATPVTGITAIDGALSTATTVQASLTLPAGTTLSSTSGTGWTCPATAAGDVLTCTFAGGLASGAASSDLTVNLLAADSAGVNSFTHDASGLQPDATADNNESSVGVTVDHAPVANEGTLAVNRNTARSASVSGSDADADNLSFSVVTPAAHGTVTMQASGSYSYKPKSGFSGADSFTFKANDGSLDSAAATIAVTVTEHAPVAVGQTFTMTHNTAHKGTLKVTDRDAGDKHTFSKSTSPKHGTVVIAANTGAFSYTPVRNFKGHDSFVFQVSDGEKTDTATVNINVN